MVGPSTFYFIEKPLIEFGFDMRRASYRTDPSRSLSPDFDYFHDSIFNKATCQFLVVSFIHRNHHLKKYWRLKKYFIFAIFQLRKNAKGGQISRVVIVFNFMVLSWTHMVRSHGRTHHTEKLAILNDQAERLHHTVWLIWNTNTKNSYFKDGHVHSNLALELIWSHLIKNILNLC